LCTAACCLCAPIVFLSACASLDPSPDIASSAAMIETRTGWRPEWNAPWSTGAEERWDGSTPLTEHTAVTLALRHNRQIRADLEQIAASRADLVQAGLLPNPMLSLAFGLPIAGTDGGTNITIGAMQQLSALWLRGPRVAGAEARLREAVLRVSDRALMLVARTRATHARVAALEALCAHQCAAAEAQQRSASILQRIAEEGEASAAEVAEAEMLAAEQRARLIESERDLAIARRELLELIGRADASADFPVATEPDTDRAIPDERETALAAANQRLDVAAALAARDAADASLREAGLGRLPELSAGAMYERELMGDKMLGPAINVEVPIFDDGRTAQARAAVDARRAHLAAESALQAAIREARTAHATLVAADQALAAARRAAAAADHALAAMIAAHEAGEASDLALAAASVVAERTRAEVVRRLLERRLAAIELERAAGGRLAP
jgi:cobalt-zinc-cadmium efflux system outer membrane protein